MQHHLPSNCAAQTLAKFQAEQALKKQAKEQRENELLRVAVSEADKATLQRALAVDLTTADSMLREANGDLVSALSRYVES